MQLLHLETTAFDSLSIAARVCKSCAITINLFSFSAIVVRSFVCLLACLYAWVNSRTSEGFQTSHSHTCIACYLNNLHSDFHLGSFISVWHFMIVVVKPCTCHDTIFLFHFFGSFSFYCEFSLIRCRRRWCVLKDAVERCTGLESFSIYIFRHFTFIKLSFQLCTLSMCAC